MTLGRNKRVSDTQPTCMVSLDEQNCLTSTRKKPGNIFTAEILDQFVRLVIFTSSLKTHDIQ